MTLTKTLTIYFVSLMAVTTGSLGCHATGRTGKLYNSPVKPECVLPLGDHGDYDYRQCTVPQIGHAWVEEKRMRLKYEQQIKIMNRE